MAKVTYKQVKALPSPQATIRSIAASIRKELEPVARQHVSQREAVVSHFRHKPDFDATVSVGQAGIELKVLLTNDKERIGDRATIGDLVKWLFVTGTKPHIIRARIAKVLRFVIGNKIIFDFRVGFLG